MGTAKYIPVFGCLEPKTRPDLCHISTRFPSDIRRSPDGSDLGLGTCCPSSRLGKGFGTENWDLDLDLELGFGTMKARNSSSAVCKMVNGWCRLTHSWLWWGWCATIKSSLALLQLIFYSQLIQLSRKTSYIISLIHLVSLRWNLQFNDNLTEKAYPSKLNQAGTNLFYGSEDG